MAWAGAMDSHFAFHRHGHMLRLLPPRTGEGDPALQLLYQGTWHQLTSTFKAPGPPCEQPPPHHR
jgi:hypothetical protein